MSDRIFLLSALGLVFFSFFLIHGVFVDSIVWEGVPRVVDS